MRFVSAFLLLGWCAAATAQHLPVDLQTEHAIKRGTFPHPDIALMVQGDAALLKRAADDTKATLRLIGDRMAVVRVAANRLHAFAALCEGCRMEYDPSVGRALMDTARVRNNIDSIHFGFAPLLQPYKGSGVIVGIIDAGIYFPHYDFRKADSTTRIRYIWDQTAVSGSNAPAPYNYGNQWNWIEINNGSCTHVEPQDKFSHGTCVAGIAAGDGSSVNGNPNLEGDFVGVAPDAELIVVRVKEDAGFSANVADAADYIFKKADALGRPCVINLSYGSYAGSHDGTDLATKAVENLLLEKKGRAFVAAAGNGGHIPFHLSYNIPPDSAYTFFAYNASAQNVYFDWWADTADFNQAWFAIGCNDANGLNLSSTQYFNAASDFAPFFGTSGFHTVTRNLFGPGFLGQVTIRTWQFDKRYHVEVFVQPTDVTHLWRLQTRGSGRFDLWSDKNLTGSSDIITELNGVPIQFPNYRLPDTQKTIVSGWACSPYVTTVGNYSNRSNYLDRDSLIVNLLDSPYYEVPGQRFFTSSTGPTRDGRMKPDVMATGSTTLCTGNANFIASAFAPENRVKVSLSKLHVRNGGTSMAAPIVTGLAALYLEKNPNANYDEINKVIRWTAYGDGFTGSLPNLQYGHGKVNGFRAMLFDNIIYGCMDTAAINYNPLANVDTGGCIAAIPGCTDSAALNFDPAATVDDGSCVYDSYIHQLQADGFLLFPNPSRGIVTLRLSQPMAGASLEIFSMNGSMVWNDTLNEALLQTLRLNLTGAVYSFRLTSNGRSIDRKLVIIE